MPRRPSEVKCNPFQIPTRKLRGSEWKPAGYSPWSRSESHVTEHQYAKCLQCIKECIQSSRVKEKQSPEPKQETNSMQSLRSDYLFLNHGLPGTSHLTLTNPGNSLKFYVLNWKRTQYFDTSLTCWEGRKQLEQYLRYSKQLQCQLLLLLVFLLFLF